MTFDDLVRQATGFAPYDYQRRIAADGLPELLEVPTGSGKTLAATLPWLFRRRFHDDAAVRESTPRWLVYVLPMRVLVEQTLDQIGSWLSLLGLADEVGIHMVMGGESRLEKRWLHAPHQDAVLVGTLDMLLSRALNRGYADNRFVWPIDFGLFNSGCQWVFDEIQLMGPALPTSLQLEGLRRAFGSAIPSHSMWMSATVDPDLMRSIDLPTIGPTVTLSDDDRSGPLATRLEATKTLVQLHPQDRSYLRDLADNILERHRPGTRTIAILNSVERAQDLYRLINGKGPDTVLIHSRFRPPDRKLHTEHALADVDPDGPGRIVVATQVLEAGVDVSSTVMFTEAARWHSVVQRAGRCNRAGEATQATLLWANPPKPEPYEQEDVDACVKSLEALEGQDLTAPQLSALRVESAPVAHPVLRRRDLLDLFDTTADLSGNDIDIGQFLRESDDLDVQVAWWDIDGDGPDPHHQAPGPHERCAVPIGQARKALATKDRPAWHFDHLQERGWVRSIARDIRPGRVFVAQAASGGYSAELGWKPSLEGDVPEIESGPGNREAESLGDDPLTKSRTWVSLFEHLEHVEEAVRSQAERFRPPGISQDAIEAAIVAGRFHDIGKAHDVFQQSCARTAVTPEEEDRAEAAGRPWAKSGGSGRFHHGRRHFRHELASALALLSNASEGLKGIDEPELAVYLVGAHHGKVRVGIRSLPGEKPCQEGRRVAMGICDGDLLPAIRTPTGTTPESRLDLAVMELGDGANGSTSWTEMALELRNRPDLGPFRLAFLEALVRLADWEASAQEELPQP